MPRIRSIKPGFFANEQLADLPADAQLLFIGLWTLADREGRLEDRPRRIKGELFRYREIDVDGFLTQLERSGFIIRYSAKGVDCIQVVNFGKHQRPNKNEAESELPAAEPKPVRRPIKTQQATNQELPRDAQEGERREGTGRREESASSRQVTPEPISDDEYLDGLQAQPAYERLDVRRVYGKFCSWCNANKKQPTRRRFVNWLNREDQPLNGAAKVVTSATTVGAATPSTACGKPARFTYIWPDCEPAVCCEECINNVTTAAGVLGFTVKTSPLSGSTLTCP